MKKSKFVTSVADSAQMACNFSIQDYSEPKAEPKASASDGHDYAAAQREPEGNHHQMSMRDIKRREFMRIDYHNNFQLGKSLNPPSFREHASASVNKATERSADEAPAKLSPNQ